MAVILRVVEEADVPSMAAIRALEWGTETFWADRISRYLSGQHSPQQALSARTAFVAIDGSDLVGFVAGHKTRRLGCDGELQWINVVKERRGLGVAAGLMTMIAAWFCRSGCTTYLRKRRSFEPGSAQTLHEARRRDPE
jgi:hypothetical protein